MKDVYANDVDFSDMYIACDKVVFGKFYKYDGYLFKEKFCVLICSMHKLLLSEAHGGEWMSHFGFRKILKILHEHFFFLRWEEASLEYVVSALHVKKQNIRFYHTGCILPFSFLVRHG